MGLMAFSIQAAQAQSTEIQGPSTVREEHYKVSGWQEPLCNKDGNLRHYYWTDIDASARYRTNTIRRVSDNRNPYRVISRVAGQNSKPIAIPPMSAKARPMGDNLSSTDVNGVVRTKNGSASRAGNSASTYTYASYNYSPGAKPLAQSSDSRNVKGRVLTY